MTKPIVMRVMLVQPLALKRKRVGFRQPEQSTPDRLA